MTPEDLFGLANMVALPGWAILIFAPRRWPWLNLLPAVVIPLLLSVLYTGLVLRYFADAGGGYATLAGVKTLFLSDEVLVAGWAHYLAFDLMVGALMAVRLDRIGVSRLIQGPIQISIFLFGPVGVIFTYAIEAALRLPRPEMKEVTL